MGGYMPKRVVPEVTRSAISRNVAVIGSGYVGLTLSESLALLGHRVECADRSLGRIAQLASGRVPVAEEGLTELIGARAQGTR